MKERWLLAANIGMFAIIALLSAGIQTVLWYQFIGAVTAPALWLLPILYFALRRKSSHGIILVYATCLLMAPMTATSLGILLFSSLLLLFSCAGLKERVKWEGYSYTAVLCGLGSLLFNLYNYFATWVFQSKLALSPDLLSWIVQALMTAIVGQLFFSVFSVVDRLTKQEEFVEPQIQIL